MKKSIICFALALIMSVPAFAAGAVVTSFSDVPSTHWAYSSVMEMTKQGLFSGTTTPVNGVGTFAPAATMTRAEFVAVVVRALYKDTELAASDPWWASAYKLAVDKGLLTATDLDKGDMTKNMSRQEMAMVLSRAAEQLGEKPAQLVPTSKIADYNSIDSYYKDYVVKAYSLGMLSGTDNKGTFAPTLTMERAQGAAVLNRLINKSARVAVDFSVTTPTESKAATIVPDGTGYNKNNKSNVKYYLVNTEGYKYLRVTMKGLNCPCNVVMYDASNNYITSGYPEVDVPETLLTVSGYTTVRIAIEVYDGKTGELASMTLENPAPVPSYSIPSGATALTDANTTFDKYDTKYANGQFVRHNPRPNGHCTSSIAFQNSVYTAITFTVTTGEDAQHVAVFESHGRTTTDSLDVMQPANTTKTYTADISNLKSVELCVFASGADDSIITNAYVK